MKNYNFEDERGLGETIRLDDINEQVQKIEEENKNNRRYSAEYDKDENPEDKKERGVEGMNNRKLSNQMLILVASGSMLIFVCVFIFAFVIASGGGQNNNAGNLTQGNSADTDSSDVVINPTSGSEDEIYTIIKTIDGNNIKIYEINNKKEYYIKIGNDTKIVDSSGELYKVNDLAVGDIVTVFFDVETNAPTEIRFPKEVWSEESVTGVNIDTRKSTASYLKKDYEIFEGTLIIYDDKFLDIDDIESIDTVTLKGIDDLIISISVEKYHGYLVLNNKESIEDGLIQIDDGVPISFDETEDIPILEGNHSIKISGSNIEIYEEEISILVGEKYYVDLSELQNNDVEVRLSVNVYGYETYVDGVKVTGDSLTLSIGKHKIKVIKEGYKVWEKEINITDSTTDIHVELETESKPQKQTGNITIYTDPKWASVYVDGEYKGVSPIMVNLEYGSYSITAKLDGHRDKTEHVTIENPEQEITIKLPE